MSLFSRLFGGDSPVAGSIFKFGKHFTDSNNEDLSGGLAADQKQLDAIYHGENNAYNLATDLVYTPIAVPTKLVGSPIPITLDKNDERTKEAVKLISDKYKSQYETIEHTKELHGTTWVWVQYDKTHGLYWEIIQDNSIVMIDRDVQTGEITGIYTHDYYTVSVDYTTTETVERRRHITKQQIDISWIQKGHLKIKDVSHRNVFGFLPVPNAHEADVGNVRGYSVIGRTLRMIKSSHDIWRQACQILAEFAPKLVLGTDDMGAWLKNNGYNQATGLTDVAKNALKARFYVKSAESSTGKGETLDYEFLPSDAMGQYATITDKLRTKCIAASPMPEIFYNNLATGNEASVTAHINAAINYVQSLRRENKPFYNTIFNQSLTILGFIDGVEYGIIDTSYEAIDLMSATERSEVLKNAGSGISSLIMSCGGTLEDIHYLLKGLYPSLPENDWEEWAKGLNKTVDLKARSETDAMTLSEMQGKIGDNEDE